jgi:2-iminobutanoate/2-iminopropanoate deaminase
MALSLAAAGCVSVPAREVIATGKAPAAIGPYSQAVRLDDTVWLSGQIGIDPSTGRLVPGGVEAETRQALENCKAVLAAAGLSLADVVQAQVFLADMADYATVNAVYATYFPAAPPARAAVQVAALPRGARVEIMLTAAREGRR